jgi:ribosome recycling factor
MNEKVKFYNKKMEKTIHALEKEYGAIRAAEQTRSAGQNHG